MGGKDDAIRIALGLNNCIDYEIQWDSGVLEALVEENDIHRSDVRRYSEVKSLRELICSLLYQMEAGEGIGCKVSDMDIVFEYSDSFTFRKTLGGTGVRAAITIRKFGYRSILHLVSQSDDVRALLPEGCEYYCAVDHDADYPHLIIQFPVGAEIRVNDIHIVTKRANRVMYFNDEGIMTLPLTEEFFKAAGNCNTLLLGGFTSVSDPKRGMEQAMKAVEYINRHISDAVIYYESSCPPGGIKPEHNAIWRKILSVSHIYSMNEDELQQHIGEKINLHDAAGVVAAIEKLSKIVPCENYVIHTKYWTLMYGRNASGCLAPLQYAVDISTTRLLYGDEMTAEELNNDTRRRPYDPEGLAFKKQLEQGRWKRDVICVPSYLVNEKNVVTIGLGDSFVGGFVAKLSDAIADSLISRADFHPTPS